MTVADFLTWEPEHNADRRWQLVDGSPVCMAPVSDNHARIQAEAAYLLTAHLRAHRPGSSVLVALRAIDFVTRLENFYLTTNLSMMPWGHAGIEEAFLGRISPCAIWQHAGPRRSAPGR